MISGILAEDVEYVLNAAYQSGLHHMGTMEASNWILLTFVKPMVNR
jgi:ribosomal protein L11 methylase PrmA